MRNLQYIVVKIKTRQIV